MDVAVDANATRCGTRFGMAGYQRCGLELASFHLKLREEASTMAATCGSAIPISSTAGGGTSSVGKLLAMMSLKMR